jgi:TPP-dependent trihydroxycyclohexane-1,2-dione (THcHDO) dehydratase
MPKPLPPFSVDFVKHAGFMGAYVRKAASSAELEQAMANDRTIVNSIGSDA